MTSGWIVALELFAVLGLVVGLALWDLRSMRRSGTSGNRTSRTGHASPETPKPEDEASRR